MKAVKNNKNMENDKALELNIGGEEVIAHRYNTSMFTFMGDLAIHDHVFVVTEEREDIAAGMYIFEQVEPEAYQAIAEFIIHNNFVQHLNLTDVPECDSRAFEQVMFRDPGDTFPEEWTHGETTD